MNWTLITFAAIWTLILPYIDTRILSLTDMLIVRAALIGALLVALTAGPIEGGVFLFAIGLTFLERNRRKIARASPRTALGNDGINQTPGFLEKVLSVAGLGAHYDRESVSETAFFPKADMGSNEFVATGGGGSSVRDAKSVLPTQPLGARALKAYDGLLWV